MFDKKYLIVFFVLFIGCIGLVNAADADNNTILSDVESNQPIIHDEIMDVKTTNNVDVIELDDKYNTITQTQDNKLRKTDGELIETSIVLNYSGSNIDVGSNAIIRGYFKANNQEVGVQNIKLMIMMN